ncbi:MAG: metallophosphoesterase [Bacteriovoracia bacterium]
MRYFLTLSLVLFCFGTKPGYAKHLVFLVSDTHAAYENYEAFGAQISKKVTSFRKDNPTGQVLFVFNGDIGGISTSGELDYGYLDFELITALSKSFDVVTSLGNHEGFDFNDIHPPQEIFLEQANKFTKITGRKILSANLAPVAEAKHLFDPYQDHQWGKTKLRIVGISLKTFFYESNYQFNSAFRVFENIDPPEYLDTLKTQIQMAANDGIDTVLFFIHDGGKRLESVWREFVDWKNSDPVLSKIYTPLLGAGHLHQKVNLDVQKTKIVEAGYEFDFAAITLDDDLKEVIEVEQFSPKNFSVSPKDSVIAELADVVASAGKILSQGDAENAIEIAPPLIEILYHPSQKADFRKQKVGHILATAIQEYAQRELEKDSGKFGSQTVVATLGFYNLLSYGWGAKIDRLFEERITMGAVKSMLHFKSRIGMKVLKGSDVLATIAALRKYSLSSARPFLTPLFSYNFIERDNEYWVVGANKQLTRVEPEHLYLVAMDHYTYNNGYKIDELDEVYKRAIWTGVGPVNRNIIIPFIQNCRSHLIKP